LITSGTTGEPKYIPVTPDFAKDYRAPLSFFNLLRCHPRIAYFNAILAIVTTDAGVTKGGIPVGAASGYLYRAQNWLARLAYALPYEIFTIEDWDAKYYSILRMSLERPVRAIITNNPRTLIILAQKAEEYQEILLTDLERGTVAANFAIPPSLRRAMTQKLRPNPLKAGQLKMSLTRSGGKLNPGLLWPELAVLSCWLDGPSRFYLPKLEKLYGTLPIHNLGYLASEGRGSLPLGHLAEGVLAIQSHFFEFIPVSASQSPDAPVLTCDELVPGQDYSILFTSANGLYRYRINDIIRVKGFRKRTPVIEFHYRAGSTFDFTGEKIYETQIELCLETVSRNLQLPVEDYTLIPAVDGQPFYCLVVEWGADVAPELRERCRRDFDRELTRLNISYAGKRASQLLGPLRLISVPAGTFENYLKHQVEEAGAPFSQLKIGHLNPNKKFSQYLKENSWLPAHLEVLSGQLTR
jgi:hypothetical protein